MRFLSARKCKAFFLAIFAAVIMVLPAYAEEPMVAVVPDYLSHASSLRFTLLSAVVGIMLLLLVCGVGI